MPRKRSLACDPKYCHICGFRISADIVSSQHPLFGTVDHYIPRSLGGANSRGNRYPAHNICNRMKKSRLMPLPDDFLANVQDLVMAAFKRTEKLHIYATDKALKEARERIGFGRLTKQQRREWSIESSWDFHRWSNEGGACMNYLLDAGEERQL